ncbi:MAG: hypothetical protein MUP63_01500 [Candidatus Nanohaloarchaeota archaeon QJJ-7]|nr:hypothetical protein [Candidatus Nanohaloarchaeota archaeon QJJ-7]
MPRNPSGERENNHLPEELSKLSERGYEDKSLCTQEFVTAFDALNKDTRDEISASLLELIFEYWNFPPSHPDMKYIESEDIWQLKIKGEESDHRVFIDWSREEPIPIILSLLHADQTHK